MRVKVSIILVLLLFSFINNLIMSFERLRELTASQEIDVFYQMVNPKVETEEKATYIKTIYKYVVFFLFFYNIDDIKSIIEVHNYMTGVYV